MPKAVKKRAECRRWLPCPGGVKQTAWLRAESTLCSARPILSFPARDLSVQTERVSVPAHLHLLQRCLCICKRRHTGGWARTPFLPDDVAGLWKAARHKEAFDDVDFLIHGLRRAERNWDSQESRRRKNAERRRLPASTNRENGHSHKENGKRN